MATAEPITNAAWIRFHRFSDTADFARALRDAGVEYVPLHEGPAARELTLLGLGSMLVQRIADQPHTSLAQVDASRALLLVPLRQTVPAVVNGREIPATEGLLVPPGSEIRGLVRAPIDWAAASLPAAQAEALVELSGVRGKAAGMLRIPGGAAVPLQQAILEATGVAQAVAARPEAPAFATALVGSLQDAVTEAFSRAEPNPELPRATREAMRLLAAAEAYLNTHVARPIYTEEICATLGVSPRSLHKAFIATCAMSPQAYLKRRRLMQVHTALKAPAPTPPLVKSVALTHGFWHLGHFARSYREMFGQPPSATVAQSSLGGDPNSAA